ncbi:hypothetical protein OU426_17800 [Frigidibacter sp. RF13]|uniref:hypothetical protein n=1 Tax=Frigidibacter sp. RF13 TaxID=2997340 RepID=UPI0022701917|nr:hypothetical protein [Frigidibacter sp. RF13]MCY1128716.1 hypothetical protein [Frigidibacter sp. RF13]
MNMAAALGVIFKTISILVPFAVIFVPMAYFGWWKAQRRRQIIDRHRDQGTIGPAAFFQGQALPRHYDAVARIGTGGPAPMTMNERILKASIGVRVFVLGLAAVIGTFVFRPDFAPTGFPEAIRELPVPAIYIHGLLLAALANGVLYIFGFEARYDRDILIVTRMMFFRREYLWRNLDWIGDDGAYELVLRFEPGGKAKVLKHSVGIGEFKEFAQQQIRKNRTHLA